MQADEKIMASIVDLGNLWQVTDQKEIRVSSEQLINPKKYIPSFFSPVPKSGCFNASCAMLNSPHQIHYGVNKNPNNV